MQPEDTKKAEAARKHAAYLLTHPGAKTLARISAEKKAKALRTEKACRLCGEVKPMSAFGILSHVADGHRYECYECRRIMWREAHPPKPKPDKPTYGKFSDTPQYAAHRKWRTAHPERYRKLVQDGYRRRHPGSKTREQEQVERQALRLRTEKICTGCSVNKPINEFSPCKRSADGHLWECRECQRKQARARYARDPARVMEPVKRWQALNGPKLRHIAQNRRSRRRGITGSHTLQEWESLCRKFNNRCVCCGKKSKLTRDHVIPITDARSSHDITNIQPLCYSCNSSKGNHHATDYRRTPFINQGQVVMF